MRAAVYTRVSTQEQAREGISLAAQEEACRRMAVEAGAMEVTVYCDEGYTGSNMRRPALQQVTRGLREAAAIRPRSVPATIRRLRALPVEDQVVFLGSVFREVEVFRGRVVLHYQGDILPPQERSTAFRYAPRLNRTDVGC
jgi:hypothetical protein